MTKDRLIDPFGGEPIDIELGPNGELPPGFEFVDPAEFRGMGFREYAKTVYGEDKPADDWRPEDVVAWFMDEQIGADDEPPATM